MQLGNPCNAGPAECHKSAFLKFKFTYQQLFTRKSAVKNSHSCRTLRVKIIPFLAGVVELCRSLHLLKYVFLRLQRSQSSQTIWNLKLLKINITPFVFISFYKILMIFLYLVPFIIKSLCMKVTVYFIKKLFVFLVLKRLVKGWRSKLKRKSHFKIQN